MILLELFITFFKIGLFTFGGGYAMIPMIQTEVVAKGWMDIDTVYNFIAISESTPGPFAVNIATFIGAKTGGVFGAIIATFGLVLPSFIIILLIAKLFSTTFASNRQVRKFLNSVKPVIIGLLIGVFVTLVGKSFFVAMPISLNNFDYRNLAILLSLVIVKLRFKKISPIFLIIIAAVLGMILYSI